MCGGPRPAALVTKQPTEINFLGWSPFEVVDAPLDSQLNVESSDFVLDFRATPQQSNEPTATPVRRTTPLPPHTARCTSLEESTAWTDQWPATLYCPTTVPSPASVRDAPGDCQDHLQRIELNLNWWVEVSEDGMGGSMAGPAVLPGHRSSPDFRLRCAGGITRTST